MRQREPVRGAARTLAGAHGPDGAVTGRPGGGGVLVCGTARTVRRRNHNQNLKGGGAVRPTLTYAAVAIVAAIATFAFAAEVRDLITQALTATGM